MSHPVASASTVGPIAVLGAGGHAKVVVAALLASGANVAGVFDDRESLWGKSLLGLAILGPIAEARRRGHDRAVIAIGDNAIRRRLADTLVHDWVTVIHPTAWLHESVKLGAGTVVMAGAIGQPDCTIGRHVILNTAVSVDHDCIVGDFAHLAPGSHLAGGVEVGEESLLGVGASVIPGVRIGAGARVAAGAVVTSDVARGARVGGVPARPLGA